jgi:hypothetical protein
MSSVVVPGVHENLRSVQRMQIALLEPRALQELDSAHLYKTSPFMNLTQMVVFITYIDQAWNHLFIVSQVRLVEIAFGDTVGESL